MTFRGITKLAWFLALAAGYVGAATFTVSKDGRGAFTTIQDAVNKAGKNDIVEILDQANYPEQVTIDSNHNGLTLRATNPDALKKPTITYQDVTHQNPKTCPDALIPTKIDFDQNGALRILWAHNITIDGIAVDGGGAAPFVNKGVWGDGVSCSGGTLYDLFHGNAGIALYISGAVTIRRCDISNGYFGIAIKDRNQGGAFANFNPADLSKKDIVPLSGFGRVGNHVFEKNRIHNNSWGMFSESAWDLGSTIRYNLIYENHHATEAVAAAVRALSSSEGPNQPGGAFMFKDVMLTPLAIYNNTFWHNYTLFCGGYRPGAQHLIFNNIFATPNEYWSAGVAFTNPFQELTPDFVYRLHNSIFSTQTEAPHPDSQKVSENVQDTTNSGNNPLRNDSTVHFFRSVRIMNGVGQVAQDNINVDFVFKLANGKSVTKTQTITGVNLPGGLIGSGTDPFPAAANVRWYEIKFKSTDPASPDFLSPNWDDSIVQKYVMNAGWPEAGIYNSDGKVADLGAIPSVSRPIPDVLIRPLAPALMSGTSSILNFDLQSATGDLTGLKIKYIRFVKSIPVLLTQFGPSKDLIVPDPATVTVTGADVKMGANTITVTGVPALGAAEKYAFFEIIIEGTAANGKLVSTDVGFIPFVKLDYKFLVEVLDTNTLKPIPSAKVGQTVALRITPLQADGTAYSNPIKPVEAHLTSGSDLAVPGPGNPPTKLTLDQVAGVKTVLVMFTKVPAGGGLEYVAVSGIWTPTPPATGTLAFYGISNGVKILPGDPDSVSFQDPPSKIRTPGAAPTIDPGQQYKVKVRVTDKFGNPSGADISVSLKSNNPTIGNVTGSATALTDSTGMAVFTAEVTQGTLNQTFELEATIQGKPSDKADLKVGKARDRLWVLYSDTKVYDATVALRGTAGVRLPVTIRAAVDVNTKLTVRTNDIKIEATPGLAIFASPTDTAPTYDFKLTAGEVVIYVTGLKPVENGVLTASPVSDNTLLPDTRANIYFTFTPSAVASAAFYADNGFARVDRVEVHMRKALKALPDSINLAWPTGTSNVMVLKSGYTLDPADSAHITVKLAAPFPAGLSEGTGHGFIYTYDPTTPQIAVQASEFTGVDSVGPLLDSARVQEKFGSGGDTVVVWFNEKIGTDGLKGLSLIVLKSGNPPVTLDAQSWTPTADGKGYSLAYADMGANAPAAGDSLKINPVGPLKDIPGNHAHALNRPVVISLKPMPRPIYLQVHMDRGVQPVNNPVQSPDFLVLSGSPDSAWTPVQVSTPTGTAVDCSPGQCGAILSTSGTNTIDMPAFTLETDRAVKYSLQIFSNLGEFVNGFAGVLTNAQMGLNDRNLTIPGAVTPFTRNTSGHYLLKITWNGKALDGQRAGTGAYLGRITVVSPTDDGNGHPIMKSQSQTVRFGLVRK